MSGLGSDKNKGPSSASMFLFGSNVSLSVVSLSAPCVASEPYHMCNHISFEPAYDGRPSYSSSSLLWPSSSSSSLLQIQIQITYRWESWVLGLSFRSLIWMVFSCQWQLNKWNVWIRTIFGLTEKLFGPSRRGEQRRIIFFMKIVMFRKTIVFPVICHGITLPEVMPIVPTRMDLAPLNRNDLVDRPRSYPNPNPMNSKSSYTSDCVRDAIIYVLAEFVR